MQKQGTLYTKQTKNILSGYAISLIMMIGGACLIATFEINQTIDAQRIPLCVMAIQFIGAAVGCSVVYFKTSKILLSAIHAVLLCATLFAINIMIIRSDNLSLLRTALIITSGIIPSAALMNRKQKRKFKHSNLKLR